MLSVGVCVGRSLGLCKKQFPKHLTKAALRKLLGVAMYMSDFSVVARSVTYSQDYYGGTSSGSLEAKKERWTRAFSLSLLMNIPKEAGRAAGCWRPPNCLKLLHAGQN